MSSSLVLVCCGRVRATYSDSCVVVVVLVLVLVVVLVVVVVATNNNEMKREL